MRIGNIWGSIRGLVRDNFSFAQIKDLVGVSGLPIHELAHLQQRYSGGASKGRLMDAIDGLVNGLDEDYRDRFVTSCIEEMLQRYPDICEELDCALVRVGWGLSGTSIYPLRLNIDLEMSDLDEPAKEGIAKCLKRYRDGDFDGAITSICGVIDSITEEIYRNKSLGDHKADSYQQRVTQSFNAMRDEYTLSLDSTRLPGKKIDMLWSNHKGAVGQTAYVLGFFRREYSDVHGVQDAPPKLIQKTLDCAVFIIRSLLSCEES